MSYEKLQFRTLSSDKPVYTLIYLDTTYDVDTLENSFIAVFKPECEPSVTRTVTMEQFRSYLGKLGRKFDDGRVRICKVEVFETDNNRAEYCP